MTKAGARAPWLREATFPVPDGRGFLARDYDRDRRWTRLIQPGSSYLGSNDPRVHFGLGAVDQDLDRD